MKAVNVFFLMLTINFALNAQQASVQDFDSNWKFLRGSNSSAQEVGFNDSEWRVLNLPHDWSIENIPGTNSPSSPDALSQQSSGYTVGGTGWYRKSFKVSPEMKGKSVHLQFDGVYMNSTIYINGKSLGSHPHGYTSFWVDLTPHLKYNTENIIAVEVANEGKNSRWYSGSGIYRHVWLKTYDAIHIAPWGVSISTPEATTQKAKVVLKNTLINKSDRRTEISLRTTLISPTGKEVAKYTSKPQRLAGKDSVDVTYEINVNKPALWSLETPALYKAVTEVIANSKVVEKRSTSFGIRTIKFDATQGFRLNGKTVKLKGGCVHHDNGPLGAVAIDRAEERKVEILKKNGFNAIRSAHNPPSPALLEACDRLGMVVIVEAFDMWREPKTPQDYHIYFDKWWKKDLESMVLNYRNHPSVIMWSIGNEIPNRDKSYVVEVAQMLADYTRLLDPTRAVTAAVHDPRPDKDAYFKTLDVAGYNYPIFSGDENKDTYTLDRQRVPSRVSYTAESFPQLAFNNWMAVLKNPHVIGDFVWTAFDYLGEASIGYWGFEVKANIYPWQLAYCGDLDICGWKRPQSYYRDVLWSDKKQLSIFVTPPKPSYEQNPVKESWSKWDWFDVVDEWNFNDSEGKPLEIVAYSSCDEVELFLNGKSLGMKKNSKASQFMAKWQVPYQAGTLKAIGYYENGKKNLVSQLVTAKTPTNLTASADRKTIKATGDDLSYITVELTDKNGVRNQTDDRMLEFELTGPGKIIGVSSANPRNTESYQTTQHSTWKGRCMVVIQGAKEPGEIKLQISSKEIKPQTINVLNTK